MIRIFEFPDYTCNPEEKQFYMNANEYMNLLLKDQISFVIDMIEDAGMSARDLFHDFFVSRLGEEKCFQKIYVLRDMLYATNEYNAFPPVYKYVLYYLLAYCEEVNRTAIYEKEEQRQKKLEDEWSFFNDIDSLIGESENCKKMKLLMADIRMYAEKANDENSIGVLSELEGAETDFSFMFDDLDFEPDSLGILVTAFINNGGVMPQPVSDVNLMDYIDCMMDIDRDRFLTYIDSSPREMSDEEYVITELNKCIITMQKSTANYKEMGEVTITGMIGDMLAGVLESRNIAVMREYTMGRAKKKIGEVDLYFRILQNDHSDLAILENKYIEDFTEQYEQLMGYLNEHFGFGITLSLNRSKPLLVAKEYIIEKLKQVDGPFKVFSIEEVNNTSVVNLISRHIVPETRREMTIYHLIYNLNDEERCKSAERARQ